MAFENMTYEFILNRLMDRVTTDYPNLDTREGSMIYNALAPAAMELAIAYIEMDNVRKESFAETASRESLFKKCMEIGMDTSLFEASCGEFKGVFDVKIELNSRWNCDLYNYVVTKYLGVNDESKHEYTLTCETSGTAPNINLGTLTPITYVPVGLTYAELTECLAEGENESDNDTIREAYFNSLKAYAIDGNIHQYRKWCDEYKSIGNCKVFPLWNGANTVKVSILTASNGKASPELVEEFQNYLDPNANGMGDGVAPIGAFVTVTTAEELTIDVTADVTLKAGFTDTTQIDKALSDYFAEISYEKNQVPYMNVGAVILSVSGVESVSNVTVNNGTANINLEAEQIPVLGTTNWTVV